jgi:glucosamine--fructose-6-phosphate aminotransferase (isomerizing)
MNSNPYITDILAQPAALRAALENYPADALVPLCTRLGAGEFRRIVLTGMGSSYNAAYPAWLKLLALPIPAVHVNSAELLHYGQEMMDAHTLLWINSQSGRSVEVVRLLEGLADQRPAFQLSMSNDSESPMARSADLAIPICAGAEATVSTKTYINMLAVLLLAAVQLAGGDWQGLKIQMQKAADAMEEYLNQWEDKLAELDAVLGAVDQVLILGRGASMAAVWNGSLIQKEAAKFAIEGMNVADFRHGPMELASSRLTVLVLEGAPNTARLNRELALDVIRRGGKALWLGFEPDPDLPTLVLPRVAEQARPLVEILPLQLMSIVLARRTGFEPGIFRHVGKVTVTE